LLRLAKLIQRQLPVLRPIVNFGQANYSRCRCRDCRLRVELTVVRRCPSPEQDLSISGNGEVGSEQIREGAPLKRHAFEHVFCFRTGVLLRRW